MRELRGANALVTGAAGGIGRHITRALASDGANLAEDAPELIVNPFRVRPLLAVRELSPRVGEAFALRTRAGDVFRRMAEVSGRT